MRNPLLPDLVSKVVDEANTNPELKLLLQGNFKLELRVIKSLAWEDGKVLGPEGALYDVVAVLHMNTPQAASGSTLQTVNLSSPLNLKVDDYNTFSVRSINFLTKGVDADTH